jgi:hypothetical protein
MGCLARCSPRESCTHLDNSKTTEARPMSQHYNVRTQPKLKTGGVRAGKGGARRTPTTLTDAPSSKDRPWVAAKHPPDHRNYCETTADSRLRNEPPNPCAGLILFGTIYPRVAIRALPDAPLGNGVPTGIPSFDRTELTELVRLCAVLGSKVCWPTPTPSRCLLGHALLCARDWWYWQYFQPDVP